MDADTALGVSSELRFLLKDGWTSVREPERFVVKPPHEMTIKPEFSRELRDEVWRIANFVAYAHFVSIQKLPDGSFVLTSKMASNDGFEIVFLPD